MFSRIKLGIIIGSAIAIIGFFVWIFLSFTVVKKSLINDYEETIKIDSTNMAVVSKELAKCTQESQNNYDSATLKQSQIDSLQRIIKTLNKGLKSAKLDAQNANDAINHYETNGLMRYFIKPLFSKCFEETTNKPDCIKTKKQ